MYTFNRIRRFCELILPILVALAFEAECQVLSPMTTTIGGVRVDYCDNDPELAVASVHLQLTITNNHRQQLILSRHLGPEMNVIVKNTAGATVYSPHPSYYETEQVKFAESPDDKMFETVKPGASTERDFVVGLPISRSRSHATGTLMPGDYKLWASRSTWPFYSDEARARRVRARWKRFGTLETRSISVQGIAVHLALPDQMPVCAKQK